MTTILLPPTPEERFITPGVSSVWMHVRSKRVGRRVAEALHKLEGVAAVDLIEALPEERAEHGLWGEVVGWLVWPSFHIDPAMIPKLERRGALYEGCDHTLLQTWARVPTAHQAHQLMEPCLMMAEAVGQWQD